MWLDEEPEEQEQQDHEKPMFQTILTTMQKLASKRLKEEEDQPSLSSLATRGKDEVNKSNLLLVWMEVLVTTCTMDQGYQKEL